MNDYLFWLISVFFGLFGSIIGIYLSKNYILRSISNIVEQKIQEYIKAIVQSINTGDYDDFIQKNFERIVNKTLSKMNVDISQNVDVNSIMALLPKRYRWLGIIFSMLNPEKTKINKEKESGPFG